jgi:hypothetical protein
MIEKCVLKILISAFLYFEIHIYKDDSTDFTKCISGFLFEMKKLIDIQA